MALHDVSATPTAAAVDPITLMFGAADTAFEFQTSSLSGLTALGSPTTENADTFIDDNYYIRQAAAAGVSWKGRYVAATTPFTAVAKLTDFTGRHQWNYAALFVSEATPGNMATLGVRFASEFNPNVYHVNWNTPTGTDQGGGQGVPGPWQSPLWFCIVANSSDDVDFYMSHNGYLWMAVNLTYNPSWTVGAAGIGINCESGSFPVGAGFDNFRIWNSAKTVPGWEA